MFKMATKVFISQPMRGKTKAEIDEVKRDAINLASNIIKGPVEFFDNYFKLGYGISGMEDYMDNRLAIMLLAKSIDMMKDADIVFFCKGWKEARGCVIEHEIAEMYEITIIEE